MADTDTQDAIAYYEAQAIALSDKAKRLRSIGQVQGANGSRSMMALASFARSEAHRLRDELRATAVQS